jgi:hypothetical protein
VYACFEYAVVPVPSKDFSHSALSCEKVAWLTPALYHWTEVVEHPKVKSSVNDEANPSLLIMMVISGYLCCGKKGNCNDFIPDIQS